MIEDITQNMVKDSTHNMVKDTTNNSSPEKKNSMVFFVQKYAVLIHGTFQGDRRKIHVM